MSCNQHKNCAGYLFLWFIVFVVVFPCIAVFAGGRRDVLVSYVATFIGSIYFALVFCIEVVVTIEVSGRGEFFFDCAENSGRYTAPMSPDPGCLAVDINHGPESKCPLWNYSPSTWLWAFNGSIHDLQTNSTYPCTWHGWTRRIRVDKTSKECT